MIRACVQLLKHEEDETSGGESTQLGLGVARRIERVIIGPSLWLRLIRRVNGDVSRVQPVGVVGGQGIGDSSYWKRRSD